MKYVMLISFFLTTQAVRSPLTYHKYRLPYLTPDVKLRAATPIYSIKQRIDHFSFIDRRTFDWRYAENPEFFNGTGPMFVFIGGESPLEYALAYLHKGLMFEAAKEQNATMYMTEHRYYGGSIPYGSVISINLLPLTVKQALADLATFIESKKASNPGLTKVIVFGGSYAGSLAAWLRLTYPKLVNAAVSASGTFNTVVNGVGYNEVVQKSLSPYPNCVSTIHNGVVETQNKLKSLQGMQQVREDYDFPILPATSFFQEMLFNSIIVTIDNVVQYDMQEPTTNIKAMCGNLTQNMTLDDYTRLSSYIRNKNNTEDNSNNTVADFKTAVSWMYQLCTELGEFVTTDSPNQPYSNTVPLSYWRKICLLFFGPLGGPLRTNAGVSNLAKAYGGLNINVTRVVFTVGTIDPWSSSGLTKNPNPESPVLIIKGSSHCAVLVPANRTDSPELSEARTKIKKLINTWVHS